MTSPNDASMMGQLSLHLLNLAQAARQVGHRAEDATSDCPLCVALDQYQTWLNGKDVR